MKIGIVTEYFYPSLGGITEHVYHYARELSRLGHQPFIITGDTGGKIDVELGGIPVLFVGRSVLLPSNGSMARVTIGYNVGRRIKEIIKSEKFDLLHIHSPCVPVLPVLAGRYANAPTFGTFHTDFKRSMSLKIFGKILQNYMDHLAGRIAVSELCIQSVSRYFNNDFRIIPNGVDVDKFSPDGEKISRFVDHKRNIFFLSRMEPRNGLKYLLCAFTQLRQKRHDCRLLIGGDGPLLKYYQSQVPSDLKLDVHFLGRLNGSRAAYFNTADIFCFPTTRASFGITLLEGMAAAKPVVAFDLPAFETLVTSGEDGLLCSKKIASLSQSLEALLADEHLRILMGQKARVTAKKFAWPAITSQILGFYEETFATP